LSVARLKVVSLRRRGIGKKSDAPSRRRKDTKNDELPQTSPADEDSLQKLCAPQ